MIIFENAGWFCPSTQDRNIIYVLAFNGKQNSDFLSFNHFKDGGEAGHFGLTQNKSLLWLLPKKLSRTIVLCMTVNCKLQLCLF